MIKPGDVELLLLTLFGAVCMALFLVLASRVRVVVWMLWGACLVPLFLLGRNYAMVGVHPVFVPDFCAVLALLATIGVWGRRAFSETRLRGFRAVALLLAVVTVSAVYRGLTAAHPDPLKGAILGLYPLWGWFAATWLLTRPEKELTRWRWVLYVPAAGVILAHVFDIPLTPGASGLYLAITGAFAVQSHRLGDSRPLVWTLVGAAVLTAFGSKRGALLAVVAALVATTIASRSSRGSLPRKPVISWVLVVVAAVGVLGLAMTNQHLSGAPVVGGLVSRVEASTNDPDSESANNVEIRFAMWREALDAVSEEPFLGAGAGRPLDVVFQGSQLDKSKSGPHNSFVGYIYYLGWPAGAAMILITAVALRRTWRERHHLAAASWFGATVGVCVTAFTNVALETTFMGLPSWLVIACAYARVGVPRGEETVRRDASGPMVRRDGGQGKTLAAARRPLPASPVARTWV
ncbi:O-antigen ligase family protein [Streptomyces sp. NPDC018693]|uniref:O-antigen ligase family protein n=1 Tax=unclassified Streptomyces TaxID=2593676 RepID=UPI0037964550